MGENRVIKTVLVADDDEAIREVLNSFITSLGYRYLEATNGLEATKLLTTESIDVLITDFQMPLMDGIELLKWCRDRNRHLPVIFMSANAHRVAKEEVALSDCCASLMQKPFDLTALTVALSCAADLIHHPGCVHSLP